MGGDGRKEKRVHFCKLRVFASFVFLVCFLGLFSWFVLLTLGIMLVLREGQA